MHKRKLVTPDVEYASRGIGIGQWELVAQIAVRTVCTEREEMREKVIREEEEAKRTGEGEERGVVWGAAK